MMSIDCFVNIVDRL